MRDHSTGIQRDLGSHETELARMHLHSRAAGGLTRLALIVLIAATAGILWASGVEALIGPSAVVHGVATIVAFTTFLSIAFLTAVPNDR